MKQQRCAGADVDVQDPEGYTPLHMAAGYLHVETVEELLNAGADLTRSDRSGRDVRTLVDNLRERMGSASAIQQRMRLEQVLLLAIPHGLLALTCAVSEVCSCPCDLYLGRC